MTYWLVLTSGSPASLDMRQVEAISPLHYVLSWRDEVP